MAYYKATIDMILEVDSSIEASDAVGEILRACLQRYAGSSSALVDWGFQHDGSTYVRPVPATSTEVASAIAARDE